MLANSPVNPTVPVTDLKRARSFYETVLGLTPITGTISGDGVLYRCGKGTVLYIYVTAPEKETHHPANFTVENIAEEMKTLSEKGVVFETLDMPGMKTDENGVAIVEGGGKMSWFQDPDGNVLSLLQL